MAVVNAQLAETAAGVTTIRAHKQQDHVSYHVTYIITCSPLPVTPTPRQQGP